MQRLFQVKFSPKNQLRGFTYLHGQVGAAPLVVHLGNTIQDIGQLEVGRNVTGRHVLARFGHSESSAVRLLRNPIEGALTVHAGIGDCGDANLEIHGAQDFLGDFGRVVARAGCDKDNDGRAGATGARAFVEHLKIGR